MQKSCNLLTLSVISLFFLYSCNVLVGVKGGVTHRYVYQGTTLYKFIEDTKRGDSIGAVDETELASFKEYLIEPWAMKEFWKWDYKGRYYFIDRDKTGWKKISLEDSLSKFGKLVVKTLVLEGENAIEKETMRVLILDTSINHEGVDYAPTISPDGKTIYFVSDRIGSKISGKEEPTHDFWAFKKEKNYDSVFSKIYNIDTNTKHTWKGINTNLNEGVASIAPDGKTLYFTACDRADGIGDCDIYVAKIIEGKWSEPMSLDRNVNSTYWDSQPSISPDGQVLYFVSNRPGPNGDDNFDIWCSVWDEFWEEWKPAVNLTAINTEDKEQAPFIGADGVTLFFSSDGYDSSLGGLDFYVSRYDIDAQNWSYPAHIGEPLSTEYDDEFITMPSSGDIMYFSSKRKDIPGSQGDLDLFMAYVEKVFRAIVVKLYVADDSGLNTITTVTVENPVSKRKEKEKLTEKDNVLSMVLTNADYGRVADSIPYIDLNIKADNPRFGSKQKILRIKNPLLNQDKGGWMFNNEVDETFEISVSPKLDEYLRSLKRSIIDASVQAYYVENDNIIDTASITIEEFQSTNTKPLLPYIFFDDNSAEIPERYIRLINENDDAPRWQGSNSGVKDYMGADFSIDSLFSLNTIETYYHILNIIGSRLQEYEESEITLTGCNSNTGNEKSNTSLSLKRVEQIRKYFVEIWNIDSSRINLNSRNLPANPTNGLTEEGLAENRRVEISSSDLRILSPVITREILKVTTPEVLNFKSFVSVKGGEAEWKLTAMQDENVLKTFSGEGSLSEDLIWNLKTEKNTQPVTDSPVYFELTVKDKKRDKIVVAKGSLPVRQLTKKIKSSELTFDKKIDKFSLILFDFGKSYLTEGNLNIVQMIKDSINPESKVLIKGYSDLLGNDNYNQKLSEKRADETAKALGSPNALIEAVGESEILYDNSLPEGRFYCRTVEIIIETPVMQDMGMK